MEYTYEVSTYNNLYKKLSISISEAASLFKQLINLMERKDARNLLENPYDLIKLNSVCFRGTKELSPSMLELEANYCTEQQVSFSKCLEERMLVLNIYKIFLEETQELIKNLFLPQLELALEERENPIYKHKWYQYVVTDDYTGEPQVRYLISGKLGITRGNLETRSRRLCKYAVSFSTLINRATVLIASYLEKPLARTSKNNSTELLNLFEALRAFRNEILQSTLPSGDTGWDCVNKQTLAESNLNLEILLNFR